MLRLNSIAELSGLDQPLYLALGVFDGVHLGHQAVIGAVVERAKVEGGVAGVMTFEPHPIRVLAPGKAPQRILASLEHKELLLEELGVKVFLVLKFTPEFGQRSAEEFAEELLSAPTLKLVAAGDDWKFGRDRMGSMSYLKSRGAERGVEVQAILPVMLEGERVSSTRVRQALRDGNLTAAAAMLGRPYTVRGVVVQGDELGRKLGYPTANIAVGGEQLPPNGVFAVSALVAGEERPGIANLGVRPTVDGERKLLEVHLFDFAGDLYGQDVEVRFGAHLRGEKKFAGLEELKRQIGKDVERAKGLFAKGRALEV